jgi:hypothetical protein
MTDTTAALTPEQERELREATERSGSFLGAARIATFNAWTVGFFAAVSLLFGLFSLPSLLVGLGLAVVARNELVGGRRTRAFDVSGLELLWRNQIGFMLLIVVYCIWSMYRAVSVPDPEMAELTDLLGGETGELVQSLTLTVYAAVIVATVLFQGLNARYYYIRIPRMRSFLHTTPTWVLDLRRSGLLALIGLGTVLSGCAQTADDPAALSPFETGSLVAGRVLENSTECVVDAYCYLRIEFADTTISAVYGSGERQARCLTPAAAFDVAFSTSEGDMVEVVVTRCGSPELILEQVALRAPR